MAQQTKDYFIVDIGLSVDIFIATSDNPGGPPKTPRITVSGWAQLNKEYNPARVPLLIAELKAQVNEAIDDTIAAMNASGEQNR